MWRLIGCWSVSPRSSAPLITWTSEEMIRRLPAAPKASTAGLPRSPSTSVGAAALRLMGQAGVRPGPEVGETLERLLAEVLEDPTRNIRDYLLSRV